MITLWHNPRCSKSRQTLALIEAAKAPVTIRRYLEDAPSADEITVAQNALGVPLIDMIRTGEKAFKEAGLTKTSAESDLLDAMVAYPILIERPIAIKGDTAVIGRPPENVSDLL